MSSVARLGLKGVSLYCLYCPPSTGCNWPEKILKSSPSENDAYHSVIFSEELNYDMQINNEIIKVFYS